MQVEATGTCQAQVTATPQGGAAIARDGDSTVRYLANSSGEVRLAVVVPQCALAASPDPACRGGVLPLGDVTVAVRK